MKLPACLWALLRNHDYVPAAGDHMMWSISLTVFFASCPPRRCTANTIYIVLRSFAIRLLAFVRIIYRLSFSLRSPVIH